MSHVVICNWRDSKHPQAGGAELYCERVAERLHQRGSTVTLLAAAYPGSQAEESVPFGRIVRRGGTFTVYLFALIWLFRNRMRIDAVIDSQNGIPFFSPLAVGRRMPVALLIHHVHQQQFNLYFRWPLNRIGQWLERTGSRWIYGRRAVCVVSPSSRSEVRRQLNFAGPIYLTPCGQDEIAAPVDAARSLRPRVIFVGRLVAHKRVDLVVRAMKEVAEKAADVELDIVGDGPELGALRDLAGQLGLDDRIRFHGRVTDRRRDELLDAAWLTVGASVGEGWGLSMMEAAARGVPAVALRVPGLQDSVIDGITGWLIDEPAELPAAIAAALLDVSEEATAKAKALACASWAGKFTWTATADRLLAVLAGEQRRLHSDGAALQADEVSDTATIVDVTKSGFAVGDLSILRGTDQLDLSADPVRLLLLGADEEDARKRLALMGIPHQTILGCHLARPHDLLGWTSNVADLTLAAAGESGGHS